MRGLLGAALLAIVILAIGYALATARTVVDASMLPPVEQYDPDAGSGSGGGIGRAIVKGLGWVGLRLINALAGAADDVSTDAAGDLVDAGGAAGSAGIDGLVEAGGGV